MGKTAMRMQRVGQRSHRRLDRRDSSRERLIDSHPGGLETFLLALGITAFAIAILLCLFWER